MSNRQCLVLVRTKDMNAMMKLMEEGLPNELITTLSDSYPSGIVPFPFRESIIDEPEARNELSVKLFELIFGLTTVGVMDVVLTDGIPGDFGHSLLSSRELILAKLGVPEEEACFFGNIFLDPAYA